MPSLEGFGPQAADPAVLQVRGHVAVSVSDRESLWFTTPTGTQQAHCLGMLNCLDWSVQALNGGTARERRSI